MNAPLIFSGPSGVGKSYLEKYLIKNYNFKRILSTTTRPIRLGEINGVDYEFITEEKYKEIEKEGGFITSLQNLNAWYGFRKNLVENIIKEGKTPVCVVVPQLIEKFIFFYPNTVAIFLIPENDNLLIKRMRMRGDSEDKIKHRLENTKIEIDLYKKLSHLYKDCLIITENNFNETVKKIMSLLSS